MQIYIQRSFHEFVFLWAVDLILIKIGKTEKAN